MPAIDTESESAELPTVQAEASVYGSTFWLAYAANTALMIAFSILFRYANFVTYVGGDEVDLGWIVGVGAVGALIMRVVLGVGIDRYGSRLVWLSSLSLILVSLLAHTQITTAHGPAVYMARIMLATGLAGTFGASLTFISFQAPPQRMGEMIGVLGSSGFIGMAFGATVGDMLFAVGPDEITAAHVDRMFLAAAALIGVSFVAAAWATRRCPRPARRRRPPLAAVLRRYHPGRLLLVAAAMGTAITLPHVFLVTFAKERGIHEIKSFFIVYAIAAFALRLATRHLTDRWGTRPVTLLGLAALAASMLLYLLVYEPWQFAFPAVVAGAAHALLFPAVVAGGNRAFPSRYRGLAGTLILAMFDLGNLIGHPAIGSILGFAKQRGWPAYAVMFVIVAIFLLAVATFYAVGRDKSAKAAVRAAHAGEPLSPEEEAAAGTLPASPPQAEAASVR